MHPKNIEFRTAAREHLNRYFARFPDSDFQKRANSALRFLASADQPVKSEPSQMAAAILYALGDWLSPRIYGRSNPLKRDIHSVIKIHPSHLTRKAEDVRRELDLFAPEFDDLKKTVKMAAEVIRKWAPCVSEHDPELYAQCPPGVAFTLSMAKTGKTAAPAKGKTPRKRSPGK